MFIGICVDITRDLIEIVRSFGDVLRALLAASSVLELLSGLLLDMPCVFLRIDGNLGVRGPL